MKITGYSERGMVNSLFYEMKCSTNGFELMKKFLSEIKFSNSEKVITLNEDDVRIYIEPSLSDFGDADVIIISSNKTIFIEAKVKANKKNWSISTEFSNIITKKDKQNSSNLFIQLYHKVRLFNELKKNGMQNLKNGIDFDDNSKKKKRKIGKNKIVNKIIEDIRATYTDEAYFVALVPDEENLKNFYDELEGKHVIDSNKNNVSLKEWSVENWGYITWKDIEGFCTKHELRETLDNFCHNEGQIY